MTCNMEISHVGGTAIWNAVPGVQHCTTVVGKARVPKYHLTEESRELDLFFTLQVLNLFSAFSVYLLYIAD